MQQSSPIEIARQTLLKLSQSKVPPTPDNFRAVYDEITGSKSEDGAAILIRSLEKVLQEAGKQRPKYLKSAKALSDAAARRNWGEVEVQLRELLPIGGDTGWASLVRNLVRQLEASHKGLTSSKKKESLERVLTNFENDPDQLPKKIQALVASWGSGMQLEGNAKELAVTPLKERPASVAQTPSTAALWRDLLIQVLDLGLLPQLKYLPELARTAQALLEQARRAVSENDIARLTQAFKPFWYKLEMHSDGQYRLHEELLQLLRLLADNMGELVADDVWLQGQTSIIRDILQRPLDIEMLYDAESSLKELIYKQGQLKHGLAEARETLKQMAATFVERLAEMTASTGEFHQKISKYQEEIGATQDIVQLNMVLDRLIGDTRSMELDALRSYELLQETQTRMEEAERRILQLSTELEQVSALAHKDFLTGALNRRGLQEALEREFSRAERIGTSLCIALLDVDHFKKLNNSLGYDTGDQALAHLAAVTREALRPTDVLARYGGEEFVIILPETAREEGVQVMARLQRELTRNFFLHDNERVLITFSAGVAERQATEPADEVMKRADQALFQAKHSGRNRVIAAESA
jgi:diguanylate cyclase